jgi:hypothetical protein
MPIVSQVVLNRLKFYVQHVTSYPAYMQRTECDQYWQSIADTLLTTLHIEIAGQTQNLFEKRWPANWWEAFKERWFTKWLLYRYPVVYEYYKVDKQTLFPSIAIPKHESVVRVDVYDSSKRSW